MSEQNQNMHHCLSFYETTASSHASSSTIITKQMAMLEHSITCLLYGNASALYDDTLLLRKESMVRSEHRILLYLSLLSSQLTTDDYLLTPMCDFDRILNDQPLSMVFNDSNDQRALTPNHLLLLRGIPTVSQQK